MLIDERHQSILDQLNRDKKVVVNDIAIMLNVSIDTIRRDLLTLEKKGLLKRTRGGAIPLINLGVKKPRNYTVRDIRKVDPFYDAIAEEACSYINENETIYLGGTSIDFLMVKYMPEKFNYTVITNSVIIADELKSFDNIDVYITPGKVRGRGSMNDPLAIEFLKNMRIDKAFISGAVISASFGLSNTTFETAALQRTVIEISKKTICLVPNIKFGVESLAKIAATKDLDIVITDWEAIEDEISRIKDLDVEVVVTVPGPEPIIGNCIRKE